MTFVASATASSSRSDDDAMSCASRRRSDKEIDAVPPPPFGLMGVAGNLCVARHRRCPCIASSSLLDLSSQDPSANVMVFLGRDTRHSALCARCVRPSFIGVLSGSMPCACGPVWPDLPVAASQSRRLSPACYTGESLISESDESKGTYCLGNQNGPEVRRRQHGQRSSDGPRQNPGKRGGVS